MAETERDDDERRFDRQRAKEELQETDLKEVRAFVDEVLPRLERVKQLPDDGEQAADIVAMDKVLDGLPVQAVPELTPLQHKAACLMGKGWDRRQVEQTLETRPGMVQIWMGTGAFHEAVRFYSDLDREDLGRIVHQELRVLLDKDALGDDTRIRLLKLMTDIGALPHKQKMDILDRQLKERQVSAEETVADAAMLGVGGGIGASDLPEEALDGEFEIVDNDEDDEDDEGDAE